MGNYKAQFLFIFRHCMIWMKMYRISRKSVCQLVICTKTGKFYCSHLNKTANNVNTPLFLNRKIPSTLNTNNLNLIATYRYCSRPFRSIIYTYIYISLHCIYKYMYILHTIYYVQNTTILLLNMRINFKLQWNMELWITHALLRKRHSSDYLQFPG